MDIKKASNHMYKIVEPSEPEKLSTQLYRKKVHYSKLFKMVHAVAILWS